MTALSGRSVWLIDDDIPVSKLPFDKDDLLLGKRPIDPSALAYLTEHESEPWGNDGAVKGIVTQLLGQDIEVLAFVDPTNALLYLSKGAPPPDVIIFDFVYENKHLSVDEVKKCLGDILSAYYITVQVYTNEPEKARHGLEQLLLQFPRRLPEPVSKGDVDPAHLSGILANLLNSSLAAHLGTPVRKTAARAIEWALVQIGKVPIEQALNLLHTSDQEREEAAERDLLELLCVKIQEALRNDKALRAAIEAAYQRDGLAKLSDSLTATIVAQVRRHFIGENRLRSLIEAAVRRIRKPEKETDADSADSPAAGDVAREFFAFRLYDPLSNVRVQTGDILKLTPKKATTKIQIAMVVTPACDLERFWTKTKGCLTLASVYGFEEGRSRARSGGGNIKVGESITANDTFPLPSLPDDKGLKDCLLFPRELYSWCLPKPSTTRDETLLYAQLEEYWSKGRPEPSDIVWLARVSEPFLTGILDKMAQVLFRIGVPDTPEKEQSRMGTLRPAGGGSHD